MFRFNIAILVFLLVIMIIINIIIIHVYFFHIYIIYNLYTYISKTQETTRMIPNPEWNITLICSLQWSVYIFMNSVDDAFKAFHTFTWVEIKAVFFPPFFCLFLYFLFFCCFFFFFCFFCFVFYSQRKESSKSERSQQFIVIFSI